jgi:hypothetical protein
MLEFMMAKLPLNFVSYTLNIVRSINIHAPCLDLVIENLTESRAISKSLVDVWWQLLKRGEPLPYEDGE